MTAIQIENVSKTFGAVRAVDDLSVTIPEASIYGFIGPNGSGKTTTMRIIAGIFHPDCGVIRVFGSEGSERKRGLIGYLPEERGIYKKMKVRALLAFHAELRGGKGAVAQVDAWLEKLDLAQCASKPVETLSKGMTQKVQFIAAVVPEPKLVILDEPFSGLDPISAESIRVAIFEIRRRGVTVILSTHDMAVAENMCDRILMMFCGKKVLDGTLADIQDRYGNDTIRISALDPAISVADLPGVDRVRDLGQIQEIRIARGYDPQRLLRAVVERASITAFSVGKPSLQEIFIRIAGPVPPGTAEEVSLEHRDDSVILIAKRDYLATVRTKAFVVGLIVAPLMFGGSFLGLALMRQNPDLQVRRIAVIDQTGVAGKAVIQQLQKQNSDNLVDKVTGMQRMPRYEFEEIVNTRFLDQQRLDLSDRVRRKQLFAFIEIGSHALHPDKSAFLDSLANGAAWYSNEGGLNETQRWISGSLNEGLRRVRLEQLGVKTNDFDEVLDPVPIENMNLLSRDQSTGRIAKPRTKEKAEGAIPFVLGILLVMIVLSISGPMLSAVAEDKMQRVFEMLLTSATSFDLMAGKILGAIWVSLTSATFYIVAAVVVMEALATIGMAPFGLLPWFLVYLVAEITMLSAFSTALGAACSSPQDARNLQLIVLLPIFIPLFLIIPILQQPNGSIATLASFFPLFTPLVMLMRQASAGGVPDWQPFVGLAGVVVATIVISWISSRIFRFAIFYQGKTPNFAELARLAFRS